MTEDFSLSDGISNTPPEIKKMASEVTNDLLPNKSKDRYEEAYQKYMDWCLENKIKTTSENVMLAYFGSLHTKYCPTSLWAYYSMIKKVLQVKNNLDISRYHKLKAYLKKQSDGFVKKKSLIFTNEQMNQFLNEAPQKLLLEKVILIIGISGACRRQELYNLKFKDIEDLTDKLLITLHDTKNKTSRSFVVPSGTFYETCKKYITLRQKVQNPPNDRFFLNFQNDKCTRQVVGVNKLGSVPERVAKFLKLPQPSQYTSHSLRRTSATVLVDAGADLVELKRHGGWKSSTVAEGYIGDSLNNKTVIGNKICQSITSARSSSTITNNSNTFANTTFTITDTTDTSALLMPAPVPSTSRTTTTTALSTALKSNESSIENTISTDGIPSIVFNNCQNCQITFNINKQ